MAASSTIMGSMGGEIGKQMGLRTFIDGNDRGPTIVFVHGWPDDHTLWDKQVAHLKDRYRCVTTDLPGYSADDRYTEKWGYSAEEVVKRLERTIEAVGNGQPVYLIAHDWGCMFSFLLERKRPDLVRKMVALDIGGAFDFKPSLSLLLIFAYQIYLIVAFLMGRPIGDAMVRSLTWVARVPSGARTSCAAVCWPYYQTWRQVFVGGETAKAMMPQGPILFMYGTAGSKKYLKFHTDWWVKKVQAKEGSAAIEMPHSSHWFMITEPDEVNRRLDAFLAE